MDCNPGFIPPKLLVTSKGDIQWQRHVILRVFSGTSELKKIYIYIIIIIIIIVGLKFDGLSNNFPYCEPNKSPTINL